MATRAGYRQRHVCECGDPGCPEHKGLERCLRVARTTVYRIDMEDETGTRMCEACADDALNVGVFTSMKV